MPDTPNSPDTPANWDKASSGYADNVAPLMMEPFAAEFADRLDASPEHEVLEVAAGSGALTLTLAGRVKSLLATDFAPMMLGRLQARLAAAGATNVTCKLMDGQALELEDASVDRAVCCFGLMLFPDRAKGFAELRRVLRPGGRAVVTGWAGPDKFEAFGLFLSALQEAFPDMPPPPAPPPVFSLADLDRFKAEMEAAGFAQVEVTEVTRTMEVPGADAVWAMITSGAPPVQMLLDRIGAEGEVRLREALDRIVRERFGDGPVTVANTATLGTGVTPQSP